MILSSSTLVFTGNVQIYELSEREEHCLVSVIAAFMARESYSQFKMTLTLTQGQNGCFYQGVILDIS